MYEWPNDWPVTIFQGTIVYLTKDKQIVKITFPESSEEPRFKRKLDIDSSKKAAKKTKGETRL